jgi:cell surface hyaluronidase
MIDGTGTNAAGVVLTETVPANTTADLANSTPGWTLTSGSGGAGSTYAFTIGALSAGATGSVVFSVDVNGTIPAGTTSLTNTVTITDAAGDSASATLTVLFTQPIDPGFEMPSVGTGTYGAFRYNPSGSPWTFDGLSGVAGNGSGFTGGNPAAPEGTQVAFLQGACSVSQSVTLAAGTYNLIFGAAQRANFQYSSQTVQVQVDGTAVGTFTPAGTSYADYVTNSFTVTAGSHTIRFVGLDPDGPDKDNTAFIDQVRVNRVLTGVADPGFETPPVGTGTYGAFRYNPSGSPWTFDAGSGVAGNGSGFTGGNPAAPEGTQVAFLQATGSISLSVALAAGTYSLGFSAAQRANFQYSSQTVQVQVDGTAVGTFTPGSASYTAYTTARFTVKAGSHTIRFVGLDPDGPDKDNTAFIDQVFLFG